jgi:outer membrane protein
LHSNFVPESITKNAEAGPASATKEQKMNPMKALTLFLLLTVPLANGGFAQETFSFSLAEAVNTALQNNPNLRASQLEQEINRYQKAELTASLLPSVSASAGVTHFLDQATVFLPANFFNPQASEGEFIETQFGLPNSGNVGITGQWMLYNQAVYNGYKVLRTQSQLTDIQLEKEQDKLAYTVSQLYYGIAFAELQKDLLEANLQDMNQLLATMESSHQNGLIKQVELDKVAVNKVNLESQLSNVAHAIQSQENLLKLFMGLPENTQLMLTDQFDETELAPILETQVYAERTPDYAALTKQMELNLLERKNIRSAQLPTLGLVYNYSHNWTGEELGSLFSSQLNYPQQYVGLNLNVPIFSGGRNTAKLHQNEVKTYQLQYQADFLKDKINTDITNARLQYNQNVQAISTRSHNVEVAQKVYAQTTLEYQQGLVPLSEVINSETALRESQSQYLKALSNALMALLDYQKASGTLIHN